MSYLDGVAPEQARLLAEVNAPGLAALRRYLDAGEAVAFLGPDVSAPLYPAWTAVIGELVDAAAGRGLSPEAAATLRATAVARPDAVAELVGRHLGPSYHAALRDVFRVRHDPDSGRSWTPVQELICRCAFRAILTTNHDPGIVDARMRVRPNASGTGFTTWADELGLDRWRTGDVFGDDELPVLFAHGHHNQPDKMVLATTEYRRAYAGKLARVLATLIVTRHLVWIGFGFADDRISAILREVAGTTAGTVPDVRHVAVMAWDPDGTQDPGTLRKLAEISYNAELILYPAPGDDHTALRSLLAGFTSPEHPPAATPAAPPGTTPAGPAGLPVTWIPPADPVPHFTGRDEELSRLSRWAADPAVRLIGVTAWGGAGKTALVTEWLERGGGRARPGLTGVFGWSFYADPSVEKCVLALLAWAGGDVARDRPAAAALELFRTRPPLLVLDGLEVIQEGPEGRRFGTLLSGLLREILTGACCTPHGALIVLTSRFPFADLEASDGDAARMLDVPPFAPHEGAALLAAAGGDWLAEDERRDLVVRVDGHALAVAVLGGILADHPPTPDVARLRADLTGAATTNARVARVLTYYAGHLSGADRILIGIVALFSRPVPADVLLTVGRHETFGGLLGDWSGRDVRDAARGRLAGLLTWHDDGTVSAHPIVRDTFRPLALGAADTAADATLAGLPRGAITNREEAHRLVDAIELLVAAGQWTAANDLHIQRANRGRALQALPAMGLALRAALTFVSPPARRATCDEQIGAAALGFYLNEAGLRAMESGDMATAREYLAAAVAHDGERTNPRAVSADLCNLSECHYFLGDTAEALRTARRAIGHTGAQPLGHRVATARQARVLMLLGDSGAAEQLFRTDRGKPGDDGLVELNDGGGWTEFLVRTGRPGPAHVLVDEMRAYYAKRGGNHKAAQCDRLDALLALAEGDAGTALRLADRAAIVFRDGDDLLELSETLPLLADCARAAGDLDAADRHVTEALTLTAPRGLVLGQAATLTVRARVYADRVTAGQPVDPGPGRDAADAALRLAGRHHLAWHELDALTAHARLDAAGGTDHGWESKAAVLRARLVPGDLDPDPLAR